jgi:hypothetical protein
MADIAKLVYGTATGSTWTDAGFTASDFNSRANGSVVVATTALDNDSGLDLEAEVSFSIEVGGTTTATSYFALYILPLNQDGTTYGDAVATGTTAPASSYWVTNASLKPAITSGNAVVGTLPRVALPAADFKFAIVNSSGVALDSTAAAVVKYRTVNRNLNG